MRLRLRDIITSAEPSVRHQSLDSACADASLGELLAECEDLEQFRRVSESLYERVRALIFLYALHRFHLPARAGLQRRGLIPFTGWNHLLQRRFEEAIKTFLDAQRKDGPSDAISSALASAYYRLGIQTLADQVRRSVRSVPGNQWMFRMGHPADQPLRFRPELLQRGPDGCYPVLREETPVRMDLTHSAWSDIFFLGMDYPEGAKVLNVSVNLGVRGRDRAPKPPIEVYLRVIDEPVLRLASIDLGASADISSLAEVFDFARDYLGLLKAAIIAAGIVPPGIEGSGQSLADLLAHILGPGRGIEMVSSVNNIPKGSRLAVSTNLLAALISACMRATGQAHSLEGGLAEPERRLVLARAILGEWIGGSGGGWQDSGGVWPGLKLIQGAAAAEGDAEFGLSRGRLMPTHKVFGPADASETVRRKLQDSLVLVHGGMAQNVGPILEMVTEKYLLRSQPEWDARGEALGVLDEVLAALRDEDVRRIGAATWRNFSGPLQTIIPWAGTHYTEVLIDKARAEFGGDFWGFWMLGGMSGGGMGFIFAPERKQEAQDRLQSIMLATKRELENALPFAMEPVVYDFAINERGTWSVLLTGETALLPPSYYEMIVPPLLKLDLQSLIPSRRAEIDKLAAAAKTQSEWGVAMQKIVDRLLPQAARKSDKERTLEAMLVENGFDRAEHEHIRADLKNGRIGLAQNRLPASAVISDVQPEDIIDATGALPRDCTALGAEAIARGSVAVVTLAAGVGSRWTQGAGVVKALHPFCKLGGRHRTFLEAHLAKSRRAGREYELEIPHVVTTSYLTHAPIEEFLERRKNYNYPGPLVLSPGRAIGLRLVPMERDLRFLWEEMPQQMLDEQAQKVRLSLRAALIGWAKQTGEGSDYTDNVPAQCLHPVGHWYEVSNMMRNGVLLQLLKDRPNLRYLLLHNIDCLGVDLDPGLLGLHIREGACLSFEVITRRLEDRGGGLARVQGRPRILEGLSMPREEDEFALSYYNSMSTWIDIQQLLALFELSADDLADGEKVSAAIRKVSARMPTYITLKEVKKRWGHGQEDIFPVAQFEKLWGDMSALPEVNCRFFVVPRLRGQQLKDQAQLDGWLRDGSAAYVESLCQWD